MKKSISVLFSAIALSLAILTMSCSRNESPIADDTQEWVQLNMAIDSLTEVYTSSMSYKPAVDTINNEKEDQTTLHVAAADAAGALKGAYEGYERGGVGGAIIGAISVLIAAIISSVVEMIFGLKSSFSVAVVVIRTLLSSIIASSILIIPEIAEIKKGKS